MAEGFFFQGKDAAVQVSDVQFEIVSNDLVNAGELSNHEGDFVPGSFRL